MNVHKPPVWRSFAIALTVLVCLLTVMPTFAQTNFPTTGVILRDANLRAGAGTTFAVAGAGRAGQPVTIVEANRDTTWYHLGTGEWIAAFLVELKAVDTAPLPGSPNVVIQDVFYDGNVPNVESDEYAVVANRGTQAINLQGWQLSAGTRDQFFTFPTIDLAPGTTCRVYTNENHADSCGLRFGSDSALWNNKGDCGYLYDQNGKQVASFCYGDRADKNVAAGVAPAGAAANRSANLRGGPGTSFPVVGRVQNGQALTIVAKNAGGDWYQLSNGQWIAAFLVNGASATTQAVPAAAPAPTVAPAPTTAPVPTVAPVAPVPTATPAPAPQPQNCDPSYPTLCIPPNAPDLDCGDIGARRFLVLPPDPHRFDGDRDGVGCES